VIGWLSGVVRHREPAGALVLDVNGVGYEVQVASLDEVRVGEAVELCVHTAVRDDAIVLFGFASYEEREFFERLLATPGVGPSTALAALRTMTVVELARAIEAGDTKRVAQIPGVGAKTASRIVLELKGKFAPDDVGADDGRRPSAVDDALRALGYSAVEIRDALRGWELPEDESAALRAALRRLGRA
jgi:holliday junction DNA helicase RuvA